MPADSRTTPSFALGHHDNIAAYIAITLCVAIIAGVIYIGWRMFRRK